MKKQANIASKSNDKYNVTAAFRYPINGVMQWVKPEHIPVTLSLHAATYLLKTNKIEVIR